MKRKNKDTLTAVKSESLPTPKKSKVNLQDVALIKKKMSKVNLYLSLLNKTMFETVAIDDVDIASEIEEEINNFLLAKAKAVFEGEITSGFSSDEFAFLKLLTQKGLEKSKITEEPRVSASSSLTDGPNMENPYGEKAYVGLDKPVKLLEKKQPTKKNSRIETKVVSILGEDGKPKNVEIETEKVVIPPPTVKRKAPPSFDEMYLRAQQDVRGMEKMLQGQGIPMSVDSSDES